MNLRTFFTVFLTVLATMIYGTHQQLANSSCITSLDLIFALDGSNSMGEENFQLQQQSLIRLINTLAVNETEVRVGVIYFSDDAIVSVELTGNRQAVIDSINAFEYPDENTRTDLAIQAAMDMFERSARGGSVPMLLEIVTDGASSEQELTLQRAAEAKARGIDIYAVGVTSAVDKEELEMIVSKDDQGKPQLFLADDFAALEASLNNATNRACVSLECGDSTIDIVFVLDTSSSVINASNFQEMKNFVKDFLIFADVDNDDIRVGIITYNDVATTQFQLSTYVRNKNAMTKAIDNLQYTPGKGANPADALEKLRTVMYTEANGDRLDVVNVVIFLAAGDTGLTDTQTVMQAQDTRDRAIQIYGVGIALANTAALDGITSKPVEENRFNVQSFNDLRPVLEKVYSNFNKFCETPPFLPGCDMGLTDLWIVTDVSTQAQFLAQDDAGNPFGQLINGLNELMNIIQDPSVRNGNISVGLIAYSETADVLVDMTGSVEAVTESINQLPGGVAIGGSDMAAALAKITEAPVMSENKSHILIVAPESSYSVGGDLMSEFERLKALGYVIVPIVVKESGTLDQAQLQMEASGANVFYFIDNIMELETAVKNFSRDTLCGRRAGDGLCATSGSRENGMGVVAHPFACDKYIQCYYNEKEQIDIGVVRQCPMGLHWHAENKTCTKPCEAMCPHDRCMEGCEPYKMEGACGAYWECEDGMSKPKCCEKNFAFVPGMGCQLDFNCTDYCGAEKWCGMCQKKPNWEEPAGYDVMIMGGNMWMPRPCFYEDFDIVDCDCTAPRGTTCPADRMYNFKDNETVTAIAMGDMEGITAFNVMNNMEGVQLKDNSAVHVMVNPMNGPNEPFTLHFRYKEDEPFSPYGETLLSSGLTCGNGNSLLISANDEYIFAEVRSKDGMSHVKVPTKGLKRDQFKDLVLSLDDGMLALSVNDETTQYIAQTKAHGNICFSCGLDIGEGLNKLSFEGTLEKIAVYSCAWPILY